MCWLFICDWLIIVNTLSNKKNKTANIMLDLKTKLFFLFMITTLCAMKFIAAMPFKKYAMHAQHCDEFYIDILSGFYDDKNKHDICRDVKSLLKRIARLVSKFRTRHGGVGR